MLFLLFQFDNWKLELDVSWVKSRRSQNSRFASFIEGNSHLSDEEILEYETAIHTTDLTDEESELTEDEERF